MNRIIKSSTIPCCFLSVLLGLTLLIGLSGCLDNGNDTEPIIPDSKFNPAEAFMYNPLTTEPRRLRYLNRNTSSDVFYHLNVLDILVGITDSQGHPGVNCSLRLYLIYPWLQDPHAFSRDLTDLFNLSLVTDNSGIAHCTFTYNQYTWPHGGSESTGFFKVSSPELPNITAKSDEFLYTYYSTDISRNTNSSEGLTTISHLEQMNLFEGILTLNNSYLQRWKFPFGEKYAVINASTIEYCSTNREAPRNEFTYDAWALYLEVPNLSYEQLNATWIDLMEKEPYRLPHLKEEDITERWLSSGLLSQVNCTPVWLIFQYLYWVSFKRVLYGWGYSIYQMSLLDPDFELVWLIVSYDMWVS